MVLKTFNLNEDAYKEFSEFCKKHGISMSKQINIFIQSQIEDKPKIKNEYLNRLNRISKERHSKTFSSMKDFEEHFEKNV